MKDTLEGVFAADRRDDPDYLRKLARRGQVSYSVVESEPRPQATVNGRPDNRGAGRRRTRLRSGKILDQANGFFATASFTTVRRLGCGWPCRAASELPPHFHVHDDETGAIDVVETVWRRGAIVGVRYKPASGPVSAQTERALGACADATTACAIETSAGEPSGVGLLFDDRRIEQAR